MVTTARAKAPTRQVRACFRRDSEPARKTTGQFPNSSRWTSLRSYGGPPWQWLPFRPHTPPLPGPTDAASHYCCQHFSTDLAHGIRLSNIASLYKKQHEPLKKRRPVWTSAVVDNIHIGAINSSYRTTNRRPLRLQQLRNDVLLLVHVLVADFDFRDLDAIQRLLHQRVNVDESLVIARLVHLRLRLW